MNTTLLILVSVVAVSSISLVGVSFLSVHEKFLKRTMHLFIGFAVGALFANVFLHLLPETLETSTDIRFSLGLVLLGMLLTFILEKSIHWHHSHTEEDPSHKHPAGTMLLIGDGLHNITDGILIASTYMVSTELGLATTLAVILHEIPQELSDFVVLIHSGWKKKEALFANFISGLTAVLGAVLAMFMIHHHSGVEMILLPIAAGNFLYIAGSDLIPELHKESNLKRSIAQLLMIILGMALMYGIPGTTNHEHEHEHGDLQEALEEMGVQPTE